MKKTMSSIILTTVVFISCNAYAGSTVTIPNTFVAGEIATAVGVNDNFTALKNGIHSNTPTLFKSDSTVLGHIIDLASTSVTGSLMLMSDNFYHFAVESNGSMKGGVFYNTPDCSGTPYLNLPQQVVRITPPTQDEYYYSPKQGNSLSFTPGSARYNFSTTCYTSLAAAGNATYYEALANDEAVTGVKSESIGNGFYIGARQ